MNPTKRLKVFEIIAVAQIVRECDRTVGSRLWRDYDASNFFNFWIFRRTNSVEITCNLSSEVSDCDKFLQDIFCQYVGKRILLFFTRISINMSGPEMQIWCYYCTNSPVWMTLKFALFIRARVNTDNFFSKGIDCSSHSLGNSGWLRSLLIDFVYGLIFKTFSTHFHSKNDVSDFALSQSGNICVIFLRKIG